ncbi:MAG: hypothetical protein ACLFN8_01495 [Candidatus Woesearchaeota archaeon]
METRTHIISKLEQEINKAEKSKFGRTMDDVVSLGIGFIPGVITGIIGKENQIMAGTILGTLAYNKLSKTNMYGYLKNSAMVATGFGSGYTLGSIIKYNLG